MTADFKLDLQLAEELGFLHFAIGGSRAHEQQHEGNPDPAREDDRDWDYVAVVESRHDITWIVKHHATKLSTLLGIVQTENIEWQNLADDTIRVDWEVLRFAGWARDGSKRSLKICSRDHLLSMASCPTACWFGVLSARVVRYCRRYHPDDGHRLFVYQPLQVAEGLSVLYDADFLHPEGQPASVNPGVACDLLLTSEALYRSPTDPVDHVVVGLLRKWRLLSGLATVQGMVPLLYRSLHFGPRFLQHLQDRFARVAELSPPGAGHLAVDDGSKMDKGRYHVFFLPVGRSFWSQQRPPPVSTQLLCMHQGPVEFRQSSEAYRASPFTSNSSGYFGQVRSNNLDWQSVFVKVGSQASYELSTLPAVQQYFPQTCIQQLLAKDMPARKLFFKLHDGKSLNEVRLDYYTSRSFSGSIDPLSSVAWFLEVELLRAEHVTDAYRTTLDMDPDPSLCEKQRIHRFFSERLQSDSRFVEFYSNTIQGICGDRAVSVADFLTIPLVINGASHPPLGYYFDRARKFLSPQATGMVRDLPVVFGLGDGHGGNILVIPYDKPTEIMHIDYEVTGFHCPFLDMAKAIYNDGFFNAFYGDLLSSNLADKSVASGATVAWTWNPEAIHIDYNIDIDDIGKVTATTRLEYVLRPMLDAVARHSSHKAQLAEDVLSCALLACALLTRNFSKRPDLLFLNLALGVRLASDMRGVFSDVFGWEMPSPDDSSTSLVPAAGNRIVEESAGSSSAMPWEDFAQVVLLFPGLQPDGVFLKRADETFELQRHFSRTSGESEGMILRRIGDARRLGMKVAPHTCICESIFAESRIDQHFAYKSILESQDAPRLLVDVGCCMGTDIRKLIMDGYPSERILGLDIESRFFNLGHALYNERQNRTRFRFYQADMLHPMFTDKHSDLLHQFDVVHSANVIHLFSIEQQEVFFLNLVSLAKPDGIIWGRQVGLAPDHPPQYRQPDGKGYRFTMVEFRDWCMRIAGWDARSTNFEAQLVEYDELRANRDDKRWVLQWKISVPRPVTRLQG